MNSSCPVQTGTGKYSVAPLSSEHKEAVGCKHGLMSSWILKTVSIRKPALPQSDVTRG
ncbi:hypothetical protein J6590_083782 [Homalodisca vitripennis]|nr:hypothetical protein J6590_083782 [Homalodisca vitripennis]